MHRDEKCILGRGTERDDGEHSQWQWRGSQRGLTVVMMVAVAGKPDNSSCFLFFFPVQWRQPLFSFPVYFCLLLLLLISSVFFYQLFVILFSFFLGFPFVLSCFLPCVCLLLVISSPVFLFVRLFGGGGNVVRLELRLTLVWKKMMMKCPVPGGVTACGKKMVSSRKMVILGSVGVFVFPLLFQASLSSSLLSLFCFLSLFKNFPLVFFPSFLSVLSSLVQTSLPFKKKKYPPQFLVLGAVFIEQRGVACCYAWEAGGHRVRSPTSVALQGTPALFSSHRVLGSCSSIWGEGERNSVS